MTRRHLPADLEQIEAIAEDSAKSADKLVAALRKPDAAFKAVPNTARQSAADITHNLATAIRALAHRLIAKEAEVARLSSRTSGEEMRERAAKWHDQQVAEYAESIRLALHPADAQRMQDHLNMHERSARIIRLLPLSPPGTDPTIAKTGGYLRDEADDTNFTGGWDEER